jgi:hypothetical protein
MFAYKFSSTATAEKPDNKLTQLLEKAKEGQVLSREEKDRIANILWGTFGSQSSTYRLAGWAWYMGDCLQRILVRHTYDSHFEVYQAPDKTALRKCISHVREMVYA